MVIKSTFSCFRNAEKWCFSHAASPFPRCYLAVPLTSPSFRCLLLSLVRRIAKAHVAMWSCVNSMWEGAGFCKSWEKGRNSSPFSMSSKVTPSRKTVFSVPWSHQVPGAQASEYQLVSKEASYSVTINNTNNHSYHSLNIYHGLGTVLATFQKFSYQIPIK